MFKPLSAAQLRHVESAFHAGAEDASAAMAKWLSVPSLMTIESVQQRSAADAVSGCGQHGDIVCVCVMTLSGGLNGHLVLCFDEASGLALADLLLGKPPGTSTEWGDVQQSAALETHNIIGCAYLNSLSKHLPSESETGLQLIPSPPEFRREFAESLFESVFLDQASAGNTVFDASARFELKGQPLDWTLLLVPDAASMAKLSTSLPQNDSVNSGDRT